MNFREKSAWVCLLSTLLVFVPYFIHVASLFNQDRAIAPPEIWAVFAVAAVLQALITAAIHIVLSRQWQREPKDERDTAIQSAAYRRAYIVLSVGVALLLCLTVWGPTLSALALGQWMLLAFVLAEVTNYGFQVLGYRRGVAA